VAARHIYALAGLSGLAVGTAPCLLRAFAMAALPNGRTRPHAPGRRYSLDPIQRWAAVEMRSVLMKCKTRMSRVTHNDAATWAAEFAWMVDIRTSGSLIGESLWADAILDIRIPRCWLCRAGFPILQECGNIRPRGVCSVARGAGAAKLVFTFKLAEWSARISRALYSAL
jgi:hypothetical protein